MSVNLNEIWSWDDVGPITSIMLCVGLNITFDTHLLSTIHINIYKAKDGSCVVQYIPSPSNSSFRSSMTDSFKEASSHTAFSARKRTHTTVPRVVRSDGVAGTRLVVFPLDDCICKMSSSCQRAPSGNAA